MNKQGILTVLGVAFSLIIAFSGWMITNMLFDRQNVELLASTGSINIPIGENSDAKTGSGITGVKLDKNSMMNMYKTLINWDDYRSYAKPHEPREGQLNMEQALDMAEAGLSYFSIRGIIAEELLEDEFTQIDAYLCANQTSGPSGRMVAEIPSEYSYWSITLNNNKINVSLRMNAVTGAIWDISIFSAKEEIRLDSLSAIEILDIYTKYLGLEGEDSVRYDDECATKGFLGNVLQATAIKSSDVTPREMDYITLSISAFDGLEQKSIN